MLHVTLCCRRGSGIYNVTHTSTNAARRVVLRAVRGPLDIEANNCSCAWFARHGGMLCCCMIATAIHMRLNQRQIAAMIPPQFSALNYMQSYLQLLRLPASDGTYSLPERQLLQPARKRKRRGRKAQLRIRSTGEDSSSSTREAPRPLADHPDDGQSASSRQARPLCSVCRLPGHNRATAVLCMQTATAAGIAAMSLKILMYRRRFTLKQIVATAAAPTQKQNALHSCGTLCKPASSAMRVNMQHECTSISSADSTGTCEMKDCKTAS